MGTPVQVRFLYPAPFKFEIGLIHGIRPFYLPHLIFCLSFFYEFTAKVGNKIPQKLETKCHKYWKQKLELLYKARIADSLLKDKLNTFGAVLIIGPKGVWKNNNGKAADDFTLIKNMARKSSLPNPTEKEKAT